MAEFTMPALGADMDEGTLLEWRVKPGDEIRKGDIIAVVDTAKSAIEVESFHTGTVERLVAGVGETVPVGTVLATISEAGPQPAGPAASRKPRERRARPVSKPAAVHAPTPRAPAPRPVTGGPAAARPAARGPAGEGPAAAGPAGEGPAAAGPAGEGPEAPVSTPLVRHVAGRLGVDLAAIRGTGRGGAITRADVESAAAVRRRARVTPLARRVAAELGVDAGAVTGTGPGGAVREEDVRRTAKEAGRPGRVAPGEKVPGAGVPEAGPPAAEVPGEAAAGEAAAGVEAAPRPAGREERARAMRQAIAALMARSKREIPHYYVSDTVDLATAMTWLRERNRELPMPDRLVPAALLLKAAALAARRVPALNGYWTGDRFVPAEAVHLGVAISLRGGGLITPAIHDAAALGLGELMARLKDLVNRARGGRVRRTELTDATITVTNLGDQGVESVTGVIYPPQVALVGFGKIVERPWAVGGLLGVRPVVTATLAADHRATDGYTGARFLSSIADFLQRPEEL